MSDAIYQRVAGVFGTVLGEEGISTFSPQSTIDDVDGWDSLNFLDIIMGLEKEFDIRIDGLDAANLTTVPSIVDYLQNNT